MAFDEVSLVDKGANQHAKVVFSKRHEDVEKASPSPGDVHVDKPLDEEEDEDVVKFHGDDRVMKYRDANATMDPRPGNVVTNPNGGAEMPVNREDLPAEVVEYIEKSESYIDTLEAQVAEFSKGAGHKHDDEDMDEVEKALASLDDNQRAVFSDIYKRAQEAEEVAKRERDLRLEREFNDRAAALDALPVEREVVTGIYKALSNASPEVLEQVESVLSKANDAVKTADAFGERGSSQGAGSAGDNAISHIVKTAEAQALDGVTNEQAVVKAMESAPDLYDRYLLEQGS